VSDSYSKCVLYSALCACTQCQGCTWCRDAPSTSSSLAALENLGHLKATRSHGASCVSNREDDSTFMDCAAFCSPTYASDHCGLCKVGAHSLHASPQLDARCKSAEELQRSHARTATIFCFCAFAPHCARICARCAALTCVVFSVPVPSMWLL
jgi:hypothetical protein